MNPGEKSCKSCNKKKGSRPPYCNKTFHAKCKVEYEEWKKENAAKAPSQTKVNKDNCYKCWFGRLPKPEFCNKAYSGLCRKFMNADEEDCRSCGKIKPQPKFCNKDFHARCIAMNPPEILVNKDNCYSCWFGRLPKPSFCNRTFSGHCRKFMNEDKATCQSCANWNFPLPPYCTEDFRPKCLALFKPQQKK